MNRTQSRMILVLIVALSLMWMTVAHAKAIRVAEAIWAHGELYDTVITPTTFISPPEHSTDTIYSFMMSGLSGQRSVADAAPGDPSFNGGRWSVQIVTFTAAGIAALDTEPDGVIDFELTAAGQVLEQEALGHLVVTPANFYFECPMLPRRR